MRKLKALFTQVDVNGFSPLIARVVNEGVTTDMALLKADLKSLSQTTGIACQVLRALQQMVIRLTAAAETELDNNTITKFSSGFSALDATLYGGFEFGLITEVCGGPEKSKFILCAIETFLGTFPNGEVHHIDTTGTFEPRQMGNQSQQMMTRIHCYEAFAISELHRLIEQIAALHTANKKPSLIVINGLANLVTAEWDAATKSISIYFFGHTQK
ncbi:hypothetical protein BJV82DRAFT_620108 [Fennellomyces sp. T-0311]|nr:hypothetical protein BJV82DRAFT_620108 [Fennellomyces sp. T-0311]